MIVQVLPPKRSLSDYKSYIDKATDARLKQLQKQLVQIKVVHINSTANGGGVAEYLKGLVTFLNALAIETSWVVINPPDEYFEITKDLHNALQGQEMNLDSTVKQFYQQTSLKMAEEINDIQIDADVWVMHDAQTLALEAYLKNKTPAIWRCHTDNSNPNPKAWKFVLPYILQYEHAIFSLPEYVNYTIKKDKAIVFPPAIDPLAPQNWPISHIKAQEVVKSYGININKPLITQVGRFDIFKDPFGVVNAYRLAKKKVTDLQLAFITKFADDDPEAYQIYNQLLEYIDNDKNVFIITNPTDNYLVLNAFQTHSDIIIQKSIKEGFGLTVTEAMFKGKPVIGGNAGGIKLQIHDGINGFIVKSNAECSQRIVDLLKNPKLAKIIGENAKRSAYKFLVPNLALNYLELIAKLLHKRNQHSKSQPKLERGLSSISL